MAADAGKLLETEEQGRWELYKVSHAPDTLHAAAAKGDTAALDGYVTAGIRMGTPESVTLQKRENILGMMPLHVAVESGQLETVEYLLKRRVDIDAGDFFRVSPMHLAAIEDHYECARLLLANRAVASSPDVEGDTPLHWAATKGHSEVCKLLITYRAPVDPRNKHEWTPLHRAVYNNRKACVHELFKLGANLHARNKDGNNALHLACFMNHLGMVEQLLGMGSRMAERNSRGKTPYELCISDGARELLEHFGYARALAADEEARSKGLAATPEAGAVVGSRQPGGAVAALSSELSALDAGKAHRHWAAKDEFPDMADPGALSLADGGGPGADGDHGDHGGWTGRQLSGRLSQGSVAFLTEALEGPAGALNAASSAYGAGLSARTSSVDASGLPAEATAATSAQRTSHSGAPASGVRSGRASGNGAPPAPPSSAGGMPAGRFAGGGTGARQHAPMSAAGLTHRPPTSDAGMLPPRSADRTSPSQGNKAFLHKYNLDKKGLFSPS